MSAIDKLGHHQPAHDRSRHDRDTAKQVESERKAGERSLVEAIAVGPAMFDARDHRREPFLLRRRAVGEIVDASDSAHVFSTPCRP